MTVGFRRVNETIRRAISFAPRGKKNRNVAKYFIVCEIHQTTTQKKLWRILKKTVIYLLVFKLNKKGEQAF